MEEQNKMKMKMIPTFFAFSMQTKSMKKYKKKPYLSVKTSNLLEDDWLNIMLDY